MTTKKGFTLVEVLIVIIIIGWLIAIVIPRFTELESQVKTSEKYSAYFSTNKDWKIVEITTRVTEQNDVWWKYAWKLTIENSSTHNICLSGEVKFCDADGFIVDTDMLYSIIVSANSSEIFTGFVLIDTDVALNIATTFVELKKGRY